MARNPRWVSTMLLHGHVVATITGPYAFMPPIGAKLRLQGSDLVVRDVAVDLTGDGGGMVQITLGFAAE